MVHERAYKITSGFSLFYWRDLTKEEEKRIEFQRKQSTFPADVYPLAHKKLVEYSNSLGLRYHGEVVGWMITHRIDKNTIRYSAFYLDRDLRVRFPGLAVKLLVNRSANMYLFLSLYLMAP